MRIYIMDGVCANRQKQQGLLIYHRILGLRISIRFRNSRPHNSILHVS